MMEYPDNESQRLQYVHTLLPYFQKNTTFTTKLEDLMTLLSIHYQMPIAGLSLVDSEIVHLFSCIGVPEHPSLPTPLTSIPRSEAFGENLILLPTANPQGIIAIPDTTSSSSSSSSTTASFSSPTLPTSASTAASSNSLLVNGPLAIRSYLAIPLLYQSTPIGSIFLMDRKPKGDDWNIMKDTFLKPLQTIANLLTETLDKAAISSNQSETTKSLLLFNLPDTLAECFLLHLLKEIRETYSPLMKTQEEFNGLMKFLSGSKNSLKSPGKVGNNLESNKTNSSHTSSSSILSSLKSSSRASNRDQQQQSSGSQQPAQPVSPESKQEMLHSLDVLQTQLVEQTKALQTLLQSSFTALTCLHNLMQETIANRIPNLLATTNNTLSSSNLKEKDENFLILNDWIRRLKKFVVLPLGASESSVKWEFDDSETWKIYDANHPLLGAIVSVFVMLALTKWKTVTIGCGILDEQTQKRRNSIAINNQNNNGSSKPTLPKEASTRSARLCIEMACFHRANGGSNNQKDETTINLLDELLIKLLGDLFQGRYEKSCNGSADNYKFILTTIIQQRPNKQRRSIFFRNSIIAFGEEGGNLIERAINTFRPTFQNTSDKDVVEKKRRSSDIKKGGSRGSASESQTHHGHIPTAQGSFSGLPSEEDEKKHNSDNSLGVLKKGRRRSSMTRNNKIKTNIINSLIETIMGTGAVKKSVVVPYAENQ